MHTLRLLGLGIDLPIQDHETILGAIFRAGMTCIFGCKRGGCGVCTATVRAGEVSYDGKTIAESALSSEQRADGVVLTCRAVAVSDVVEVEFPSKSQLRIAIPLAFSMATKGAAKAAAPSADSPGGK